MTPMLVAGSMADSDEISVVAEPTQNITFRYVSPEPDPESRESTYSIPMSARLTVVLIRSDECWIARAPEVNALGHGDTWEAALDNLIEAVEQYLEYIRDDAPVLAPAIASHADFVALLGIPRRSWFTSVSMKNAPSLG